jgi:hypothetical protein
MMKLLQLNHLIINQLLVRTNMASVIGLNFPQSVLYLNSNNIKHLYHHYLLIIQMNAY